MIKFTVSYVYEDRFGRMCTIEPLAESETYEINSKKEFRKLLPHIRKRKKEIEGCNKYLFDVLEPKRYVDISAVSWFEELIEKLSKY
jgi:hypothetical protein